MKGSLQGPYGQEGRLQRPITLSMWTWEFCIKTDRLEKKFFINPLSQTASIGVKWHPQTHTMYSIMNSWATGRWNDRNSRVFRLNASSYSCIFLYTANLRHTSKHFRFYVANGQREALQGALACLHGAFALFKLVIWILTWKNKQFLCYIIRS